MNSNQLDKIPAEITRLQNWIDALEAEANFQEREFADAKLQYESKLAGPPNSIEVARNTAEKVRKKIIFLQSVQQGNGSVEPDSLKSHYTARIAVIDSEIQRLNQEKVSLYQGLSMVRYLESVIKD